MMIEKLKQEDISFIVNPEMADCFRLADETGEIIVLCDNKPYIIKPYNSLTDSK